MSTSDKSPRKTALLGAVLCLFLAGASPQAFAQICRPTNFTICNTSVQLPSNIIGTIINLTLPSPYVHQNFQVQCTPIGRGTPVYVAINPAAIACTLDICPDTQVRICGADIPVPGGSAASERQDIQVPPDFLAGFAANNPPTFTVECDDTNGTAGYNVVDSSHIFCNDFACPTADLSICGISVSVPGGAKIGDVMNFTMPPPFEADPFQVRCLGNRGNAPVYSITDNSMVTCSPANGQ